MSRFLILLFLSGVSVSAQADPAPTPSHAPTPRQSFDLRNQFMKSQRQALKALEHQSRTELQELEVSQRARRREWDVTEREKRREFFKANEKGADRRAYIKDFVARGKEFNRALDVERTEKRASIKASLLKLKEQQKAKRQAFEAALKRGETPSQDLWQ